MSWRHGFIITCEHATNRLPSSCENLGLTRAQLDSHIAWDPGASATARACARVLGCACHEGRTSRLLVDLNRGERHPRLIARQSFGVRIPGNEHLSPEERQERLARYWTPYRHGVIEEIRRVIRTGPPCIHLSMHSFTPIVGGVTRKADLGLLYDPARTLEKTVVGELAAELQALGFHVRRNFPYRGASDGLTTHCRRLFPDKRYAGIEIELNQRLLSEPGGAPRIARRIAAAVARLAS